jgi:hypothetical protein
MGVRFSEVRFVREGPGGHLGLERELCGQGVVIGMRGCLVCEVYGPV